VGSNSVTLADIDGAVFDAAAQVSLGAVATTGTITAASGLTLNSGGNIAGQGTIDTPNNPTMPLVNNGSLNGNSLAELLVLPGYITGTGSLDQVQLTGTYAPGFGPATVILGSAEYDGTLDIEIGGLTAGSDYDQLNHTLAAGAAQLGGTLDVSLLNGFMPQVGDMFDILTAAGGVTGTFATTILPTLAGDLFWNINYGPNSVELTVAAPSLAGDFNGDGIVDAADYVVWRKSDGTQADYDVWRTNYGAPAGAGAGAAKAMASGAAVPEPATLALLIFAAVDWCLRRVRPRRSFQQRRVMHVNEW
jgi:hypothetical protein